METLIDMVVLPTPKDYALWGFEGCGFENYWTNSDEFFENYKHAAKAISQSIPEYKEYEMLKRFEYIVDLKQCLEKKDEISRRLYNNYWKTYSAKCYVNHDVRTTLKQLGEFKLGVVSNFMVSGGIEELLERNQISDYFQFVVTSINTGWRKPHRVIYEEAIKKAKVNVNELVFVGDDFLCDYAEPRKLGMHTILLDRNSRYLNVKDRISNFCELKSLL